jgi:hypothetical protein
MDASGSPCVGLTATRPTRAATYAWPGPVHREASGGVPLPLIDPDPTATTIRADASGGRLRFPPWRRRGSNWTGTKPTYYPLWTNGPSCGPRGALEVSPPNASRLVEEHENDVNTPVDVLHSLPAHGSLWTRD